MIILVTNDDGICADGIVVLKKFLSSLGDVWVVAPDRERNAISNALTLHRPLRLSELSPQCYAVNGTPADCVNIAINYILSEKPQLLVSGINRGANVGNDVNYSGTVAGALEGARMGIPSFAISLSAEHSFHYEPAARCALRLAQSIVRHGLPVRTMLNVNVPDTKGRPIDTYRITTLATQSHRNTIEEKCDPRGMSYYWIGRSATGCPAEDADEQSDYRALEEHCISVTPLDIDRTHHACLQDLAGWKL